MHRRDGMLGGHQRVEILQPMLMTAGGSLTLLYDVRPHSGTATAILVIIIE